MVSSARVVIIGGGVIGLSVAYHLAKQGVDDVLLVERNALTSGTSWHAAGIIGPLRATMSMTRLAAQATQVLPELTTRTGQETGYRQTGGLWLARDNERMRELARIAALADGFGLTARLLDHDGIADALPLLRVDDLSGALWVTEDGQANPVDVCMAYARGARAGGVAIREGVACVGFERRASRVRSVQLSTGEDVRCESVVNCAGAWARAVGLLADVPVPLQAVEHMYVVTEPVSEICSPFPIVRDLDAGIYVKEDAGRLVLGGFEDQAKPFDTEAADAMYPFIELPEDWDQFEPFLRAGLERVPVLERVGIQRFMNGPESFTPDTLPLLGESPYLDGFYVAAGFNSTGIVSSAGVGQVMASWVMDGEAPLDLWDADIARFDGAFNSTAYLRPRVSEAVGEVFHMHWPLKQPRAGRDLRTTPLHEALDKAGAVFGVAAGWERPLWFARTDDEHEIRHSYADQHWWQFAQRESLALRDRVALLDLSPFTKIDVCGPDAVALMQWLCCNELDVPPGRTVYTQMLNERAGIEADVTVVRMEEGAFRIVGGAPTRQKDLAWVRRQAARRQLQVELHDRTEDEAVIGVAGPQSRTLIARLCDGDISGDAFAFGASGGFVVAGVAVRITRISFSGELGYELSVASVHARALHQALVAAGADLGLAHCGLLALDACRVEKGYRHWGHDIGPDDSPLEAGLSFAVAWDKPTGFQGSDALEAQRATGVARRLVQFAVSDAHPLLLHDEPIYRDGVLVSYTTSGARGFRTGRSICFTYLPCENGTTSLELFDADFEIEVAGERFALRGLSRPAYDPDRLRARDARSAAA